MDKNKLIDENYQNIYNLAQRISKTYGLPFDVFEDLQKEGYISLIEQYESYNENSEASFWTYAYKGVRNKNALGGTVLFQLCNHTRTS